MIFSFTREFENYIRKLYGSCRMILQENWKVGKWRAVTGERRTDDERYDNSDGTKMLPCTYRSIRNPSRALPSLDPLDKFCSVGNTQVAIRHGCQVCLGRGSFVLRLVWNGPLEEFGPDTLVGESPHVCPHGWRVFVFIRGLFGCNVGIEPVGGVMKKRHSHSSARRREA